MRRATVTSLSLLLAAALAGGCSSGQQELQDWMAQQRQQVKPGVAPLVAPKRFEPQPYMGEAGSDPFGAQKLVAALRQEPRAASPLLEAEVRRRREPLEAHPLDTMAMVGTLARQGRLHALLRVDGKQLHQVRVGDHIGQNHGRITRITDTGITLREIVQDAAGDWVERPATLQLQEAAR